MPGFDPFNASQGNIANYCSYKDHDITLVTYIGKQMRVNRRDLLVHNFKTTSTKSLIGGLQIDCNANNEEE